MVISVMERVKMPGRQHVQQNFPLKHLLQVATLQSVQQKMENYMVADQINMVN